MGRMRSKKPNRFVIQRHEKQGEPVHWDLMLESGGVLETYRIGIPPEQWSNELIEAGKIFDHPLKFLTYEGTVNNGKGKVEIVDAGTYRLLKHNKNRLKLEFSGVVLKKEFIFSTGGRPARRE